MKSISLYLTALAMVLTLGTIQAQEAEAKASDAIMTFEETVVDYGTIEQNSDPLRTFKFKNEGTEPLTITNAKGSCGCTVPKYPKEPILPGQEAEIEVRYDTKRVGNFSKTVTLTTNAKNGDNPENPGRFVLRIKGNVLAADELATPAPVIAPGK